MTYTTEERVDALRKASDALCVLAARNDDALMLRASVVISQIADDLETGDDHLGAARIREIVEAVEAAL